MALTHREQTKIIYHIRIYMYIYKGVQGKIDANLGFRMSQKGLYSFFLFIYLFIYLLVIHLIHMSVYMSIPISQFITPQPPPLPLFPLGVHTFVLYICVSISALQTSSSVPFSRFHIYALIYDICFSLSDLLHSV